MVSAERTVKECAHGTHEAQCRLHADRDEGLAIQPLGCDERFEVHDERELTPIAQDKLDLSLYGVRHGVGAA